MSNTKLLKLHAALTRVKEDFGSRDKLVAAVLKLEDRVKDEGYKSRLEGYPTPRLLDHHDAAEKRRAAAPAPKPAAPKKRTVRTKKAREKAAAAAA